MVLNRNPEYFFAIARERNISRAAEKLFLSQSSLSQYIARLESALGMALLDRSQNPLELTAAGRIYYRYLERSGSLYRQMQTDLDGISGSCSQVVHLGLGTWRGSILLPQLLPTFLALHPNAQVGLHEFPISQLLNMVREEQVDFAVMNTTSLSPPESLTSEVILYERILLVMHREHPLTEQFRQLRAQGARIDLRRLEGERLISLDTALTVGGHVNGYLERNLLSFPNRLHTTNNSTALNLVARNLGFCFLVESGLPDALCRPELTVFDLQSQDLVIPLSALYRKSGFSSPLAQDFLDLIRDYYRGGAGGGLPLVGETFTPS